MKGPSDHNTRVFELREAVMAFNTARDWEPYFSPKNLAMSIAIEAAELMEIVQWVDSETAAAHVQNSHNRARVAEELADVLIYCLTLCNTLDLDLTQIVQHKMARNGQKYPVPSSPQPDSTHAASQSDVPDRRTESEDSRPC